MIRPTPVQDRVFQALDSVGMDCDAIVASSGLSTSGVRRALLALERSGKVERIKIGPPVRRVGKHHEERVRIPKVFWRRI